MLQRIGVGLIAVAVLALPGAAMAQDSRPTKVDATSQVNTVVLHVDGMS